MSDGNRPGLRSARWFAAAGEPGVAHRAYLKSEGITQKALSSGPIIGIANSWSEFVNCNLHFRGLAQAVKRGVLQAGGLPLEFPTISLGEVLMKPTTML
jgi:dihydroxy-acid dehydratase